MTRRSVTISLLLAILVCGLVVLGVWVAKALPAYRGHNAFLQAEKAYSAGRWFEAKTNYTWYLARHPGDPKVLPKYIESCLKLRDNRYVNLQDAGRAMLQLAMAAPEDHDAAQRVLEFNRQHGLWGQLDYSANIFLREHPGDPSFSFFKALALDHLGNTAQATTAYKRLVESGKAPSEAYGSLALLLEQQGLQTQGWQVLENALSERPQDAGIRVERSRFQLAINDVTRAAEEIEAALAIGEPSGETLLAAAKVRIAQKDWETARTLAEQVVNKLPASVDGYLIIANGFLANRQADKAISFLSGLDPLFAADHPQLYLLLAEMQIDAGLLDEADRTAETYRKTYPNDQGIPDFLSARKLLRTGQAAAAAAKLERIVEQYPEIRVARYFLVLAYLDIGECTRARNALEMYIKNNPGDERAHMVWDTIFTEASTEATETAANKLLDDSAPYPAALVLTADALMRRHPAGGEKPGADGTGKKPELAKRLLERAIQLAPSSAEGYRNLVFLYISQNDLASARQVLARAKEAGVAPAEIKLPEAGLALAENHPDRAKTLFDEELALGEMVPQKATQWAELFADHGQLQTGLDLLEAAGAHEAKQESLQELDLGRLRLCVRYGETANALKLIESLASKYTDEPTVTHRLNDVRLAIAKAVRAPGDHQDKATAERLLADIGQTEPDRPEANVMRARMLLEKEPPDVDGAEALCAAARKADASNAEVLALSGDIAARKGRFAAALDYASQANAASPNNSNVLMTLARSQLQMEQFPDAVTTLEKLRARDAANLAILDSLARAYTGAGRFGDAEKIIQQLETAKGGQVSAPLRACLLLARKDWHGAEQLLTKIHDGNPDDLWAIHCLAKAIAEQGKRDKVEEFLNECASRQPDLPELWVELGNAYLQDANPATLAKASSAFTQALVLRANYIPALRGLLDVQVNTGNIGGALGLCNRFLAENPDAPDILERKAGLLAKLPGRQQEALNTIEHAIEITQQPGFFYLRGYLRLGLGEDAGAIEDFQRVNQAHGASSANLDGLMAEAYIGLGNRDLAIIYYKSAREKASKGEMLDSARLDRVAARLAEGQ